MVAVALYIVSIVVVNVAFVHLPLVSLGEFGAWPPASLLVGVIFVLRDYAQRAIGHWVLAAMALGIVVSYLMASPMVAIASATAFAVSEAVDWIVYTVTKRPFRDRVLLSSAIGTPIDSAVFLGMLGFFGWVAVLLMTLSKMVAALLVWKAIEDVPVPSQS